MKRTILTAASGVVLIFLAVACTNPVASTLNASNWGLVGSWARSTYMVGFAVPTQCYLLTIRSDGSFRSIDAPSAATVVDGTYQLGDVRTEGNTRTYQVVFQWGSPMVMTAGALVRITDGTQFEVLTNNPYNGTVPTTFNPSNPSLLYTSFTRQ